MLSKRQIHYPVCSKPISHTQTVVDSTVVELLPSCGIFGCQMSSTKLVHRDVHDTFLYILLSLEHYSGPQLFS